MKRPQVFAVAIIAAVVAAAVYFAAPTAEAGLFFRRDGSARQPVRRVVAAIAERREARGAVAVFPRMRSAALACGSTACGSEYSTAAACASGDCYQAERVAAAANANRRAVFFRALTLFAEADGDPSLRRAVVNIQRNPATAEAFRREVQDRFGFTPDTIREWLKLFLEFAPQIIEIILKFV